MLGSVVTLYGELDMFGEHELFDLSHRSSIISRDLTINVTLNFPPVSTEKSSEKLARTRW